MSFSDWCGDALQQLGDDVFSSLLARITMEVRHWQDDD